MGKRCMTKESIVDTDVKIADVIAGHIKDMLPKGFSLDFAEVSEWGHSAWITSALPTHVYIIKSNVSIMRLLYTKTNMLVIRWRSIRDHLIDDDVYLDPADPDFFDTLDHHIMAVIKDRSICW
jgi:hypothetical protein